MQLGRAEMLGEPIDQRSGGDALRLPQHRAKLAELRLIARMGFLPGQFEMLGDDDWPQAIRLAPIRLAPGRRPGTKLGKQRERGRPAGAEQARARDKIGKPGQPGPPGLLVRGGIAQEREPSTHTRDGCDHY